MKRSHRSDAAAHLHHQHQLLKRILGPSEQPTEEEEKVGSDNVLPLDRAA